MAGLFDRCSTVGLFNKEPRVVRLRHLLLSLPQSHINFRPGLREAIQCDLCFKIGAAIDESLEDFLFASIGRAAAHFIKLLRTEG